VERGNPETWIGEKTFDGVAAFWVAASRFAFLAMTDVLQVSTTGSKRGKSYLNANVSKSALTVEPL
jgi:hypothetical protein